MSYLLLNNDWDAVLGDIFKSEYFISLGKDIALKRKLGTIYPERDSVFRCFAETPYHKINVVLIGQDPYHDGSACGLSFSNEGGGKISPSLRNILRESGRTNPDLSSWAKQGVLLLNTALTVEKGKPCSHLEMWKEFTNFVIRRILEKDNVIWLLLGNNAKNIMPIQQTDNQVIVGHPSPLNRSVPFLGTGCFNRVNEKLILIGKQKIEWEK